MAALNQRIDAAYDYAAAVFATEHHVRPEALATAATRLLARLGPRQRILDRGALGAQPHSRSNT
jgi:hypothetical protein